MFIWTEEMARTLPPGHATWQAEEGVRWPDDAFKDRRYKLQNVACRAMSIESLLAEKESYERYSGRPLRQKDLTSIKLLHSLLRSAG